MKIYNTKNITLSEIPEFKNRAKSCSNKIVDDAREFKRAVLANGDKELIALAQKYDSSLIESLGVSKKEIEQSGLKLSDDFKAAVKLAISNIRKFHNHCFNNTKDKIETSAGVTCWQEFRSIDNVGLYIPGGTAPLFSTLMMLGVPAQIAGCKNIIVCTPSMKDGNVSPETLYVAKLLGLENIYKIGGAGAIFAMAYGTGEIPKVDKIFGPGNQYVTAAKMLSSNDISIDMPAGPSEVLIIADDKANSKVLAADILSQAEHGTDSQSVLLCNSQEIAEKTLAEIELQLSKLSRKEIARRSIENSFVVVVQRLKEAVDISNEYAPEHLIINCENCQKISEQINNAGSVFCGKYSAESFGDYLSGTNHTLPTSGFAKSVSGLRVEDFGKWISFQEITRAGFAEIALAAELLAYAESLEAHKQAVSVRREL